MILLLDTQIYLWYLADSPRLTEDLQDQIAGADDVLISAVSIWEAAIKIGLGTLDANIADVVRGVNASGFSELPVTVHAASVDVGLPAIHADPFDRLLVAQAISGRFHLVSADAAIAQYSAVVQLVRPDANSR